MTAMTTRNDSVNNSVNNSVTRSLGEGKGREGIGRENYSGETLHHSSSHVTRGSAATAVADTETDDELRILDALDFWLTCETLRCAQSGDGPNRAAFVIQFVGILAAAIHGIPFRICDPCHEAGDHIANSVGIVPWCVVLEDLR